MGAGLSRGGVGQGVAFCGFARVAAKAMRGQRARDGAPRPRGRPAPPIHGGRDRPDRTAWRKRIPEMRGVRVRSCRQYGAAATEEDEMPPTRTPGRGRMSRNVSLCREFICLESRHRQPLTVTPRSRRESDLDCQALPARRTAISRRSSACASGKVNETRVRRYSSKAATVSASSSALRQTARSSSTPGCDRPVGSFGAVDFDRSLIAKSYACPAPTSSSTGTAVRRRPSTFESASPGLLPSAGRPSRCRSGGAG